MSERSLKPDFVTGALQIILKSSNGALAQLRHSQSSDIPKNTEAAAAARWVQLGIAARAEAPFESRARVPKMIVVMTRSVGRLRVRNTHGSAE
jgi:hypothetical protein